ncbi:hypothetical protein AO269_14760 [Pseudomonas putida]|nr:hypothetical protein AO269_14760 [Pseudomonas putida]
MAAERCGAKTATTRRIKLFGDFFELGLEIGRLHRSLRSSDHCLLVVERLQHPLFTLHGDDRFVGHTALTARGVGAGFQVAGWGYVIPTLTTTSVDRIQKQF